ncbi:hypothetical protein GMRT_11483 [Giardia muris]|uniref:Uncharacterized protein n=1 Tax=Giardia muris TaxID=5742 RepID=A0A4Z1T9G0_GIAMU|nr:hypothetical protein GMRT_11483 [Giardia muris]|eukprot:TNJ29787.1 hypothetical protein GMRT_11483 [Giardia muris]
MDSDILQFLEMNQIQLTDDPQGRMILKARLDRFLHAIVGLIGKDLRTLYPKEQPRNLTAEHILTVLPPNTALRTIVENRIEQLPHQREVEIREAVLHLNFSHASDANIHECVPAFRNLFDYYDTLLDQSKHRE